MWAARLSITTMAFGRSCSAGASTCSTKALNTALLVAPPPPPAAMLMQATTPSRVKAPSTVSRFQCPQGTLPRARLPLAARACVRVSRVSIPLSSRKTRRLGSSAASSARHAARSPTRSGRSCSSARRVFCAPGHRAWPDPPEDVGRADRPVERPAQGRAAHPHPGALSQPPGVRRQRQRVRLRHKGAQLVQRLAIQPGRGATPRRLGLPPPVDPGLLLPAVERRLTHAKQSRNPRAGSPGRARTHAAPARAGPSSRVVACPASHAKSLNRPNQISSQASCRPV